MGSMSLLTDNDDLSMINSGQPLAARMRPRDLNEYVGQKHLLSPGRPLFESLQRGNTHSMILWGPPGTGKTTLARIIANHTDCEFESISAVLAGVKDIREAVERAKQRRKEFNGQGTLLFVDEVHRFNKAQQDAFLPHIEEGTIVFVGATTENPSFALNNALLSRARTYVLKSLDDADIRQLLTEAVADKERGLGHRELTLSETSVGMLAAMADGDARRALNVLEIAADLVSDGSEIDDSSIEFAMQDSVRRFDAGGDYFYDQISAMHKSVRGSSPDAALYWMTRMLDGGCDPIYIARRLVRMASEDIGNADPRALSLTMSAWDVQTRLGSPEGELALAQAVVYLASAPKSNAVYMAFNQAMQDVSSSPSHDVPIHLRNAPTKLAKSLDHGAEYRYAHDEPERYAAGENYFPEALADRQYYFPVESGLELKIKEKLAHLRALDAKSQRQRYRGGKS